MSKRHTVLLTDQARKDSAKLSPKLQAKLREILESVLAIDPKRGKRLVGELKGLWSYRLTYQDRIVYRIDEKSRQVLVLRARTHYGE